VEALTRVWSQTRPGYFTMRFVVPSAPWLTAGGPHPLTPGDYTVGVPCLAQPPVVAKGPGFVPCDRQSAEATATFHLTGPGSPRCQTMLCAQLTLSPDRGPPGTEIQVGGWAPLNLIIDDAPIGYNLVIETSGASTNAPAQLGYVQQDLDGSIHGTARLPLWLGPADLLTPGKYVLALETLIPAEANGAVPTPSTEITMLPLGKERAPNLRVVLAPTTFIVSAAPTWASLGSIRPIGIQPGVSSNAAAIAGDPAHPRRLAYCASNGIPVSEDGGQRWSTISTAGIALATGGSPYELISPASNAPGCSTLALDPAHSGSLYATFILIRTEFHSAPPTYAIGFFTDDAGKTWHLVPPPTGLDLSTFGGFQVTGRAVLALFAQPAQSPLPPPLVEATSDGGRTWNSARLPCPATRPCVRWGAADLVVTGMGASLPQLIERSTDDGRTWTLPSWPSVVATRYGASQLVALGPTTIALVSTGLANPAYPFLLSTDSGATWQVLALPALPHTDSAPLSFPGLIMLPNGDLLAWENGAPVSSVHWDLVKPGATAWCSVSGAALPGGVADSAPFQIIGDRLWWLESANLPGNNQLTIKGAAISALHCGSQ
jgi:hypothetical protein